MRISNEMVEQWGIFEVSFDVKEVFENPFTQVWLCADFCKDDTIKSVAGFYDGDGIWKLRFMPIKQGDYVVCFHSNAKEMDGLHLRFTCIAPGCNNHGPVRIANTHHFTFADGTSYLMMGTTAYAFASREEPMKAATLAAMHQYGLNKVRMLFFPKRIEGLGDIDITFDPPMLPFQGDRGNLDFRRFNPAYFQSFEDTIQRLMDLGIQAEVILFHYYDYGFWGINPGMTSEDDLFYIRYIAARLNAFRNVWWCLCNEYDLILTLQADGSHALQSVPDRKDWDAIGKTLTACDTAGHMITMHNFNLGDIPDYSWMTHISYQNPNTYEMILYLRGRHQKPVIADEYGYEGNIPGGWGDLTPENALLRHVQAMMAGGYATHGETIIHEGNKRDIFWAYGGMLRGESPARLQFLKAAFESCPYVEMEPDIGITNGKGYLCMRKKTDVFLYFFPPGAPLAGFDLFATGMGSQEYDVTIFDIYHCKTYFGGTVRKGFNRIILCPWALVKLTKQRSCTLKKEECL